MQNLRNFLEQNPMDLRDDRLFRIDPLLVNELSIVAKMLQPAAHHGMCLPPRK